MELIFFWLILGIVVALIAKSKGRNPGLWFLYGFLIWPVALVHVLLASRTGDEQSPDSPAAGRVPCPFCAELVKPQARVCPHCRRDLTGFLSG
ncbi:MAG: zinc ribbon domain-containing protein [Proteobacteria bacterium]|nr:zinc ribbon domain-containing protein [Pseudomonadota bacterium]